MNPNHPDTYSVLVQQANRLVGEGQFAKARDLYYRAVHLRPPTADLLRALGGCCYECNQIDEAIAHTRASLVLDAGSKTGNLQLGFCCLLLGHAEQGWAGLAYRKQLVPRVMPDPPPLPAWNGEPLNGAGIVLIREQGFGDIIQFVRYAPKVQALGGRVYLDVHAPLRRLFASQAHLGVTLTEKQSAQISRYAYFMDLPRLFGDHPHHPCTADSYIRIPDDTASSQPGNEAADTFKVGLAWAGSVANGRDRLRSIGLETLRPLLDVDGCRFFSLLNGARAQELASSGLRTAVTCLADRIHDFMDLALAVDKMDLVITVDTAVAHLAGAMGKPVWLLACTPADWRWGAEGAATAWYPSMRVFRQTMPGDWQPVIEGVSNALAARTIAKT